MSVGVCVCGTYVYSLAVEPQYPQLCIRQSDVDKPAARSSSSSAEMLGPMELSAVLNSLPCSLTFTADDHLRVIQTLVALVSSERISSSSCSSSSSSSNSCCCYISHEA